jgi:hypothetical protein
MMHSSAWGVGGILERERPVKISKKEKKNDEKFRGSLKKKNRNQLVRTPLPLKMNQFTVPTNFLNFSRRFSRCAKVPITKN